MEVIGAGLPRTGTLTQKMALEMLGVGPCYHWVNVLADLDQVELWQRALDGEDVWDEVFAGQRASVDWPGGYFYAQLAERYPEAKVLLSVRDPQAWERSFRETIVEMCHGSSLMPLVSRARAQIDPRWHAYLALVDRMFWSPGAPFSGGHARPEQLIEQMARHNDAVIRAIPPERLLVWEVGEGWQPLCEFLGVDVPAEPLPHANDREVFVGRVIGAAIAALQSWHAGEAQASPAPA